MAPKKRRAEENLPDIRRYFRNEDGVPGSPSSKPRKRPEVPEHETSPEKLKKAKLEEAGTSKLVEHLHQFKVRFGSQGQYLTVDCKQPGTVLGVIKRHLPQQFKDKTKKPEENIIVKLGKGNDCHIVPTHFPCSCVEEDERLTVITVANVVEKKQQESQVLTKENYSVFFIDKEGGKYTKTKTDLIFRCNNIPETFRYYCVYSRKGMTVAEALRLDGRFVDNLGDFTLSDNETGDITLCTETVDKRHGKRFKICLPKKTKQTNHPDQQENREKDATQQTNREKREETASMNSQNKSETKTAVEHAAKKGVSLMTAMQDTGSQVDLKEIYRMLRQQFPKLREWMESRIPGRSFREALKLKKENFGKIQQSFSEVHTVRTLVNLSGSICLINIKEKSSDYSVQGTGFVLLDEVLLTNAHLFKDWQKSGRENWWEYLDITAKFNFEKSDSKDGTFKAKGLLGHHGFDYVLLELIIEGQTSDQTEADKIPPGLLKNFGPVPEPHEDGGACIIGHPAEGVKKMDVTCIITKENLAQAVAQNVDKDSKDYVFTVYSIHFQIKRDPLADIHVTYNSFMYHGSSGSPVFDASGRVFGLHTGGFFYDHPNPGHSVIEFAFPLLSIFENLLGELKKNGMEDLLGRIQAEAKGNPHLEVIIDRVGLNQKKDQTDFVGNREKEDGSEGPDSDEEMETS